MATFTEAENIIRRYLKEGTRFTMDGIEYVVKLSGKPCPQKKNQGEPKTDIYVYAESGGACKELRISYKKTNAHFLENKMRSERAAQIFGDDWQSVIEGSTKKVSAAFNNVALVYLDKPKGGRTEQGSITLGWRFELFNTIQGELSGKMDMNPEQVYEAYAGEKLADIKKNAKVGDKIISDSGTAEYILIANEDEVSSAQDIIDKMRPIKEYIQDHPDIYFGCKALNYRSLKKKIEGNRSLAVHVDYRVTEGVLEADINFENPLEIKGNEVKKNIEKCLREMGKEDATKLNDEDVRGIKIYRKEEK